LRHARWEDRKEFMSSFSDHPFSWIATGTGRYFYTQIYTRPKRKGPALLQGLDISGARSSTRTNDPLISSHVVSVS